MGNLANLIRLADSLSEAASSSIAPRLDLAAVDAAACTFALEVQPHEADAADAIMECIEEMLAALRAARVVTR